MENQITSRILYCDSQCIIVNKIAGEAVEGAGKSMVDLPRLLAEELSGETWPPALPSEDKLPLPSAVHRLDVPVSGCAVFARTNTALRLLNETFRSSAAEKLYWAVLEKPGRQLNNALFRNGIPVTEKTELVHWIKFDTNKNKSYACDEESPGCKKAILRCRFSGRGDNYLFMEIELISGRHHQIRAQLERLGLHIKGDLKYGAKRSERSGGIRLHARSIKFPCPDESGKCITAQANPPISDNLWQAFESNIQQTA